VQANEAFSRVSGYSVSDVLDQLPSMLTVDDQQEGHLRYVLKQLHLRGSWEGEVWLKRRSGEHYPAWVGITAVLDDEGDLDEARAAEAASVRHRLTAAAMNSCASTGLMRCATKSSRPHVCIRTRPSAR
jgi:PAS domain-containing protein